MSEKLDKDKISELLRKADEKWYTSHGEQFKYQEHLEFSAEYLVKHYKGVTRSSCHEAKARGGHQKTPRQGLLNH